ncbi:hypothetical protein V6N11_071100 [Hibiscus sabdariffa]|uniref:Reverse transcriptase zinc-binding domain-containing protein n=1 Tax=Hibiscus sabdariffa TaxID=183260 RepID=A0ABR2TZQ4_9ROSI
MKLGMALISKPEALWVTFIKQKYKILSYFPESITYVSCTSLWRSLAHIWDEFRMNIAWCVSDGSLVDVWTDVWVPDIGRLYFCRWRWDDSFTIKSAYAKCMDHLWNPCSNLWSIIWSQPVPHRIRVFMWLAFRQKLMTNLERQRRCLGVSTVCLRCDSCESILHVLRDYPYAHDRWSATLGSLLPATFFAYNLDVWLLSSLRSSSSTPYPDVSCFLVPTLQHGLHKKNFKAYCMCCCTFSLVTPIFTWVCLNTDGYVCPRSKYARAGGIIRDSSGAWVTGYGRGIGIADVQNDCSKVISELSDGKSLNGYSVLIRNILSLCQRNWAIQFLWIPRAANQVVDKLFKQIAFPYFDMIRLDAPPDYLQSQLEQDNSSFHGFTVA